MSLLISFALAVDNFGMKCVGKQAPLYLIATVEKQYVISVDWSGSQHLILALEWDYAQGHVTLSILKYVLKALR